MSAPFSEYGPFAVGEICRIVGSIKYPELIGTEVRITELPHVIRHADGRAWTGYGTDLVHKGFRISPQEEYLRRRKPPSTGEQSVMQMFVDAPQRVEVLA